VIDKAAQRWRELGFFAELDDKNQTWKLSRSRARLLRFRDILLEYAAAPRHSVESEHEHYGPYGDDDFDPASADPDISAALPNERCS
jgi:hypothetical protein